MKVIHRSESQLIVEDRPWLLGLAMILMALLFLGAGMALLGSGEVFGGLMMVLIGGGVPLLIGALMVQRVRLTFDRDSGRLTRTRRSVLGLTQVTYALDRLSHAVVGVSTDSDGSTYRTELKLRHPDETVPFTTYYTSGLRPERICTAVNQWLGTDRT
jgi:hypothetical protein